MGKPYIGRRGQQGPRGAPGNPGNDGVTGATGPTGSGVTNISDFSDLTGVTGISEGGANLIIYNGTNWTVNKLDASNVDFANTIGATGAIYKSGGLFYKT